jgi:hypothetical protein
MFLFLWGIMRDMSPQILLAWKEQNWRGWDPGEGPYKVSLRVQELGKDLERKRHIAAVFGRLQGV